MYHNVYIYLGLLYTLLVLFNILKVIRFCLETFHESMHAFYIQQHKWDTSELDYTKEATNNKNETRED